MRVLGVYQVLADPTRRRILEVLRRGSLGADELCRLLDVDGDSLGHHLVMLKAADLVRIERRGASVTYIPNTTVFEDLATIMADLRVGDVVSLVFVLVCFAVMGVLYPRLPNPVPTPWEGTLGWIPKPWGAMVFPAVAGIIWGVTVAIPRMLAAPSERDERFGKPWTILQVTLVGFLALSSALATVDAVDASLPLRQIVFCAAGMLCAIVGNSLSKSTRASFVGIRTPWALASEEVWLRTQRLTARLVVLSGATAIIVGLAGLAAWKLAAAFGLSIVIPALYSFLLYTRLGPDSDAPAYDAASSSISSVETNFPSSVR